LVARPRPSLACANAAVAENASNAVAIMIFRMQDPAKCGAISVKVVELWGAAGGCPNTGARTLLAPGVIVEPLGDVPAPIVPPEGLVPVVDALEPARARICAGARATRHSRCGTGAAGPSAGNAAGAATTGTASRTAALATFTPKITRTIRSPTPCPDLIRRRTDVCTCRPWRYNTPWKNYGWPEPPAEP
jgi:hypothetical protein